MGIHRCIQRLSPDAINVIISTGSSKRFAGIETDQPAAAYPEIKNRRGGPPRGIRPMPSLHFSSSLFLSLSVLCLCPSRREEIWGGWMTRHNGDEALKRRETRFVSDLCRSLATVIIP